jgi:hypothetical protein
MSGYSRMDSASIMPPIQDTSSCFGGGLNNQSEIEIKIVQSTFKSQYSKQTHKVADAGNVSMHHN